MGSDWGEELKSPVYHSQIKVNETEANGDTRHSRQ